MPQLLLDPTLFGPVTIESAALASLALRLVLGIIFIVHGFPKLIGEGPQQTADFLRSLRIPAPVLIAVFVGTLELLGGIFLIMGYLTSLIAALFALEMIGTTLAVKLRQGLVGGYEFDLVIFAAAIALVFLGGGTYSVDGFIIR